MARFGAHPAALEINTLNAYGLGGVLSSWCG
jgi:hypothetical protein